MKKLLTTLSVAAVMLIAAAPAQAIPGFSTGIDLALNVPVGDVVEDTGMASGGFFYASFDAVPIIKVTARAGYLHALEEDKGGASYIPVLVGLKWFPVPVAYLAGELGMVCDPGPVGAEKDEEWKSELGGTFGAGVGLGPLDVRASLFFPDIDEGADRMGVLLTAGYRF